MRGEVSVTEGPMTEPLHLPRGRPRGRDMLLALREPGFRLFAIGQTSATIALWVQRVVQDWIVLELTGSAALVGALVLMQFGPTLLFGMWGGLIADRYRTRDALLVVQTGAALVSVALCVFAFAGALTAEVIFAGALLLGLFSVVEMPARQVMVGELVSARALPNAISINSMIFQTGTMVGPAVGGLLIPLGGQWAFLIAAVLMVVYLVMLSMIRVAGSEKQRAPRGKGQIVEALRYCVRKPVIFWTLFLLLFVSLVGLNWPVLLSSMADRVFHSGGTGYGLYTSAVGVGALVGAVLSLQRSSVRLRSVYVATAGFMAFKLASAFVPWEWVFVVLVGFAGCGSVLMWTAANTTLQSHSNRAIRGRVMSLYLLIAAGGQALGGPLLGWIIEHFDPRVGMAISGGVPLVAALATGAVLAYRARRSRPRE